MGIALVNKSKFSADQKKEVFDTSFVNFGDCFQQYTAFSVRLVKRNRKNVYTIRFFKHHFYVGHYKNMLDTICYCKLGKPVTVVLIQVQVAKRSVTRRFVFWRVWNAPQQRLR